MNQTVRIAPYVRAIGERDEARAQLAEIRAELAELQRYYTSPKFTADDSDYAHVRTDVLPRLARLQSLTLA